jgi:endonuclease YncB( thermonuclease family)
LLAAGVASVGLLACAPAQRPAADSVTGPARVVDGDTLEVRGLRLRLAGVDAPELRQTCARDGRRWPCGRAAARALARKIDGRPVACAWRETDRWDRPIASCRVGGVDLAGWLAERGWALAFRRYATTYIPEERRAKAAGRGLWSGSFVPPWEYRAG